MAANSPNAVATSASEMPGATMASVACCTLPSEEKALMMPHTVPNRPTYGLVLPTVASVARLCSRRSISFSCATRIARREPSSSCSLPLAIWRRRANSRKPNSKMPAMPVAPPRDSMARYSCARSSPDQNRPSKRSASRRARAITLRLLKMICHEVSDASSSRPITICTGTLACTINLNSDSGSFMVCRLARYGREQELGQAPRAHAARIDARHTHIGLDQQRGGGGRIRCAAIDALREVQRCRPVGERLTGDLQLIVQACRSPVIHVHAHHHEQQTLAPRELQL